MGGTMEVVTLADLERQEDAFDADAFATPEIDHFCSSTDWILPAKQAWAPDSDTLILRGEHGWAALLLQVHADGISVLAGFESMWGFACPLIGPYPHPLVQEFAEALAQREWHILLATGLPLGSAILRHVGAAFSHHDLRCGPRLRRWEATLHGGVDGYLARRSPRLRSNLRRTARRAREEDVTFEPVSGDPGATYRRVLDVEARSWKGPVGTGLLLDEMTCFYRPLAERLGRRLRTVFARHEGTDIGYILGGVRKDTYRGFQFSFDRRF
ncbi:MAG: GNAT family N-acetyltransferase, partial [Planctomycetota bacterium]